MAEKVVEKAVTDSGARATILRIGQIIPSQSAGSKLWNPSEAVPLLLRSALTTVVLSDSIGGGEMCSWLPVDTLAKRILDLADFQARGDCIGFETAGERKQLVYNVVHPHPFSWVESFLPALRSARFQFDVVSYAAWLDRLASSEKDLEKNPSRKLPGYWEKEHDARHFGHGKLKFETKEAERKSRTLRQAERGC